MKRKAKYKVGDKVIFEFCKIEFEGEIIEIINVDLLKYIVLSGKTKYICGINSQFKFSNILTEKTSLLQKGKYVKEIIKEMTDLENTYEQALSLMKELKIIQYKYINGSNRQGPALRKKTQEVQTKLQVYKKQSREFYQ